MSLLLTIFVDIISDVVWFSFPFLIFKMKDKIIWKILALVIFLSHMSFGIASRLNETLYNSPVKALVSFGLIFLYYFFCFNAKVSHRLITFAVFTLSFIIFDLIGSTICVAFNIDYRSWGMSRLILIIMLACQYVFFIIYRMIFNKVAYKMRTSSNMIYFDIIILSQFFAGASINFALYLNEEISPQVLLSIPLLSLIGITIAIMIVSDIFLYRILITNAENFELKRELETANYKNELELEYYNKLKENAVETNKLNHDMSNLISTINVLIENNSAQSIEDAKRISEDITSRLTENKNKHYCANELVDLILINKSKKFSRNKIDFTARMNIPNEIKIGSSDICSLFTNVLDNAFDACMASNNKDKLFAMIEADYENSVLKVNCSNYSDGTINMTNEKLVSTKEGHKGLGVEIVKNICNKYNGNTEITNEDNVFSIKMVLGEK